MDNKTHLNIKRDPEAIHKSKRIIEIDVIKGLAVINMVIFHFFYLSHFMGIKDYPIDRGILRFFAKSAHTTFIFMVGVNLAVSYQKYNKAYTEEEDGEIKRLKENAHFGKQVKRAMFLIGAGIIMSILSYLGFGSLWVKFGIFHFIGVAILLAQPILSSRWLALTGAVLVLLLYLIFKRLSNVLYFSCQSTPFLCFISGAANVKYSALDHFSIIPNFAIICLGIFVGHTLYKDGKRNFSQNIGSDDDTIDSLGDNIIGKSIGFIGKHSFLIYFLHFIVFYFVLFAYKRAREPAPVSEGPPTQDL
jgi:uncharacterized membrane protein